MKNLLLGLLATFSLAGCMTPSFQNADVKADYRGKITKLTIVVDTGTMKEAFMLGKKPDIMGPKYAAAVLAIKEGLISNFQQVGVDVVVESGETRAETTAITKEIRTSQVLITGVSAYMTATTSSGYRYWDSGLSWEFAYYDRDRAVNPSLGPVWRTKTGMMMFNFGCNSDYKDCGDRFGRSIVEELRRVELIAKH
jgi:hypothetical protein